MRTARAECPSDRGTGQRLPLTKESFRGVGRGGSQGVSAKLLPKSSRFPFFSSESAYGFLCPMRIRPSAVPAGASRALRVGSTPPQRRPSRDRRVALKHGEWTCPKPQETPDSGDLRRGAQGHGSQLMSRAAPGWEWVGTGGRASSLPRCDEHRGEARAPVRVCVRVCVRVT